MTNLEQLPPPKAGRAITKQERVDAIPRPGGPGGTLLPQEKTFVSPNDHPKLSPEQDRLERLVTQMAAEMKKIAADTSLTWGQKQQQEEKLSRAYLSARDKITKPSATKLSKPASPTATTENKPEAEAHSTLPNPEKGQGYAGFGKKIKNLLKKVL